MACAGTLHLGAPCAVGRLSRRHQAAGPQRHVVVAAAQRSSVTGRAASVEVEAPSRPAERAERAKEAQTFDHKAPGDPWQDEPWATMKWTVYRGVAYDLTDYLANSKHPGGSWLLRLAIGRDCTALFESYHLRPDVAAAHLARLPKIEDFPIHTVPVAPYPNDSDLYNSIRERVRNELFDGAADGRHRTGSEGAAAVILGYAAVAYAAYAAAPNVLTGGLLGLAGAWIGLTIQHCGNHGAMSKSPLVNNLMGLTDDLIGGSSLMWRYHHQVSHHIHCNDDALDEDVFSALPFLRFDPRLPREWFHKYQHIYMWATFPFLQLVFQIGDWQALFTNRTKGATLYGVSALERATVVAGKLAHYGLIFGLPWVMHGPMQTLVASACYTAVQGIVLAATFAVSHNLEENKPVQGGSASTENLYQPVDSRDWAEQQVLTSSNWGGVVGNFFTGGLNLQIEHHLFPAISFMHYPAIAKIVREECEARGINYVHYDTLPEIIGRFSNYMRDVGSYDMPATFASLTPGEVESRRAALARL
ncbi:unnamed protein product [Pedinophyceae sp. YPF-701]|nr:unnamed protein product [Pedinophyceae sp. YPF-701]